MISICSQRLPRHIQTACFQKPVIKGVTFNIWRNFSRDVQIDKSRPVEHITAEIFTAFSKSYCFQIYTVLEQALRNIRQIIGQAYISDCRKTECSGRNCFDRIADSKFCDFGTSESILAYGRDRRRQFILARLSNRKPDYFSDVFVKQDPVDTCVMRVRRNINAAKRLAV